MSAAAKAIEDEGEIESLMAAKGFAHAVAYVSADDANIVVGQKELSAAQVAQIKDIVMESTGLPAEKIKIVESESGRFCFWGPSQA